MKAISMFMFTVVLVVGSAVSASQLALLDPNYPRAFFFRQTEGAAAQGEMSFQEWDRNFSRLMGIMGKALDEEIPGRSIRNIDFFTRFKKAHPEQAVLLHLNGNSRDPRFESDRFFAGHWLYHNGATITQDVKAEGGESVIHVSDPSLFRTSMGRFGTSNEDVGLCLLDDAGRPDWSRSEQVQLISVDPAGGTIRVKRACYGTSPMSFPSGKSCAAAHCSEGPWAKTANLLWFCNYSTTCPRDARGRSCSDVLVDHLSELFSPGGGLSAFDGLEFDVLFNACPAPGPKRGPDCDADGKPDSGIINGRNEYGIGVFEFCRKLRERLGKDRLIMADGALGSGGERSQRAFGILNGIESEGWPNLSDWQFEDWSGGLNRLAFWRDNAMAPALSYINHKYNAPGPEPGRPIYPEVPFSTHRLVFAAGVFTDAALCSSLPPPRGPDRLFGIWDEFRMGAENRLGWLGKPTGSAVRLALSEPDLLKGTGKPIGQELLRLITSEDAKISLENGKLKLEAKTPGAREFHAALKGLSCSGPDLFVSIRIKAEPMTGYPAGMARIARVALSTDERVGKRNPGFMTWIGSRAFDAGFYFPNVASRDTDLALTFESSEPVYIEQITAHACPDAIYREFERGVVIANPSPRPYTFDLAHLFPHRTLRRFKATAGQDPATNNGQPVGSTVTLGPKDALFLAAVREEK